MVLTSVAYGLKFLVKGHSIDVIVMVVVNIVNMRSLNDRDSLALLTVYVLALGSFQPLKTGACRMHYSIILNSSEVQLLILLVLLLVLKNEICSAICIVYY